MSARRKGAKVMAALCALALLAPAGCHLIFPFQVDPVLVDAAVGDGAVADLLRSDRPVSDFRPLDAPLDAGADDAADDAADDGAPDAKPSVGAGKTYGWGQYLGTSNVDQAYDVAVDSKGNVYVIGVAGEALKVNGNLVAGQGWLDVLLTSFDAKGKHRWTKLFGGSGEDVGRGVALDSNDNVYITGRFRNTGVFGGAPLKSGADDTIFLASYTTKGVHRWSKAFGGTSKDEGRAVAVDALDNVYVTGVVSGSVSFAGTTPMPSSLPLDVFLASYDKAGKHRWSNRAGGSSGEYGEDVAVRGTNVYLTGKFQSPMSFGGDALTSSGGFDIFLTSYTTAGVYRWSKGFGGGGYDAGDGLAVDGQGRCHLVAYGEGVDFGGGMPPPKGGADLLLASFDAAGTHLSTRGYGGTSSDFGFDLALDGADNLVVAGSFQSVASFGGATLTSSGYDDVLVASYTQAKVGSHRWSVGFGGTNFDSARAVAVDATNNLYVVGNFSKSVNFGGGLVTSAGNSDIFMLKLTP